MFRKLAGLTALAGLFLAGTASAQGTIVGSAHDFTTEFGISDICVVCHAPHENLNAAGDLLWNHTATTTTFTPYTSPSLQGTAGVPTGVSLLCLGCHDGTVAADAYGGAGGTAANTVGSAGGNFADVAAFGAALGNDHPIAIDYPLTADGELQAFNNPVTFADSSTGTTDDLLFGTAGTESQTVECGSCHDVHDTVSNGQPGLLKIVNTNSALCLACHSK